jgi:hypothetical protein
MNRFACLLSAGLALATGPRAGLSAPPSIRSAADVDVLVDGAPQPRYARDGRWYIEARKGREYAVRLHNPYASRVAVALSVDGLNTIDARETTARDARKWVLGPHETVTISGWQTSQAEAHRFEFTTEERSYGQTLGKTANLGMIAAVFFKERVPTIVPQTSFDAAGGQRTVPRLSAPTEQANGAAASPEQRAGDEYAATGMGRRTSHAVEEVWLDLEDTPAQTVNVRYEFRPQLVRLGILPPAATDDPLRRREGARGFEPGFCPEPPRQR